MPKVGAKVMEESDLTDADRRQIRQNLRYFQRKLRLTESDMQNPESDAFSEACFKSNALFMKVLYTREAVLDGENLAIISKSASQQCQTLIQVPRYDAQRLILKLKQKLSKNPNNGGGFDWLTFGQEASVCFSSIPFNTRFLLGPLDAGFEPKTRKRKFQQDEEDDDDEEEEHVKVVKAGQQKTINSQLSAVERNIKVVAQTLEKETKRRMSNVSAEEHDKAVQMDAVQFLFNPNSFTQTVENIFHYSFSLKAGKAGLFNDQEGRPKVQWVGDMEADDTTERLYPVPRQAIVSLNMKDWRALCETHKVHKGTIPHREA